MECMTDKCAAALSYAAAGNNVRLQRDLDQAQAAPAAISFLKMDADRLQAVYYSYDSLSQADQASSSSSSRPSGDYGSSHSPGARPSSARRTSRQQAGSTSLNAAAAGSVGVRPGSSAARRNKELLQQAGLSGVGVGAAAAPSSPNSSQRIRPPSAASSPHGTGSLRAWGIAAGGGSLLGAAGDHPAVPKARGLVRGSTDALQFTARPASRGL
jgi:hypothetical protein